MHHPLYACVPPCSSAGRRSRLTTLALVLGMAWLALPAAARAGGLTYPEARRSDYVEDYHGQKVPDPYRWMEDLDSPEVKAWIKAENAVTDSFLSSIPYRDEIRSRLTQVWDYEKFGVPFKRGGRYFMNYNDGLQNQDVLYTLTSLDGERKVLLDPNKLSESGTVSLSGLAVSDDGKYLAYGIAAQGSDWQEWHVRDIETGEDLDDTLKWIKFSGASWSPDGKGFYYSRFNEPEGESKLKGVNYYNKLYYHRIGTPQSDDVLVYERPDQKEWGFSGKVTDDGRYLVITVSQGTDRRNLVFYKDLTKADAQVVELISEFKADYSFIDNVGERMLFRTDDDAPKGRVISIDPSKPEPAHWTEVVPAGGETLTDVSLVGGHLVAEYIFKVQTVIKIYTETGERVRKLALPGIGRAYGFEGKRDDPETFYKFESFNTPGVVFRYDVATGVNTEYRKPKVAFDPEDFEVRQFECFSKDGTRIPLFLVNRKGVERNGENPTYLYGYGGFNIPVLPRFSPSSLVWMDMGGIFAVANIRGGGEFGKEWHLAGTKLNKQNCFDDFIAAAEWLLENNFTTKEKLAIGGGSNGGLLVGACMTQRPDLFGAAVPAVGVMDMLRFEKFTIGWAWVSDYGTTANAEEFAAMYKYSPLHNLKQGTSYPATLVLTGDHDDRVWPSHSFKFAAALQRAQSGDAPTLIRIQTDAGHGAGKPTSIQIDEAADKWAFLMKTLGAKPWRSSMGGD